MTRFAYLIAAHDNGDQLNLLLDRLLAGDTDDYVVLHLDAKSALWKRERARFAAHPSGRVILVPDPVRVYWGHQSQLAATLRMLDIAIRRGFTLAHHISGADWPVTTRAAMVASLPASGALPAFADIAGSLQADRMHKIWFTDRIFSRSGIRWIAADGYRAHERLSTVVTYLREAMGLRRSEPFGSPWTKGWSWWSLPHDVATIVANDLRGLLKSGRLRFTACADEHVVPSILTHRFGGRLASYNRFICWSAQHYHPDTLTSQSLETIRESQAWFVRKVDLRVDRFFVDAFAPFA